MSYPDEDEARVEGMIADLAAAGALPPCPIPPRVLAQMALEMSRRSILFDRIMAERESVGRAVIYTPADTNPPRPRRTLIPSYADGFIGIRRHRGLWHRLCILAANR